MPKIYIKEKNKKFVLNVNLDEAIKSMIYSYEYIFDKSYKYKLINENKKLIKLEINLNENHCFFKNDNVTIFNQNFNQKSKILDIDENYIILNNINIENDGYIKLNKNNKIKNFTFNSCTLDYKKKMKDYKIMENSTIVCNNLVKV